MNLPEQLYKKLLAEYDAFIGRLKGGSPQDILDSSFEKQSKEDIITCFQFNYEPSDKECTALLTLDNTLDELYRNWRDSDISYMDELIDNINDFMEQKVERYYGKEISQTDDEETADSTPDEVTETTKTTEPTLPSESTKPSLAAPAINGEVKPGDWVIATGNNDYKYLIGTVTAIDKLGTPEHSTDNETDDIHVDFTAFYYPPERFIEIERRFSALYGKATTFGEIPLDDVVMAPKMLLCITHLGQEEISFMGNLRDNCEAFCNCFSGNYEKYDAKQVELMERMEKNYDDYQNSLLGYSKQELIDMAAKIHATSEAHSYMTMYNRYESEDVDFYLKFENPLEIVADIWYDYCIDLDRMSYVVDDISDRKADFNHYPQISDTDEKDEPSQIPQAEQKQLDNEKPKESAKKPKPKTLANKLQAANEKVKSQDTQGGGAKKHNKDERD